LEAADESRVAIAEVVLAGIVRAVGKPEADRRRAHLLRDLDAIAAMPQRLSADGGIRVAEASEAVGVVAEKVRVDRPDPHSLLLGVAAELRVVLVGIPRDVVRHARAASGKTLAQL